MMDARLAAIEALIQQDPGGRGLQSDPTDNLVTASHGDFTAACRLIATAAAPRLAIVTGFTIPSARPPCGETDGPLGALFLARALTPLGIPVAIASDGTTLNALRAGVKAAGLEGTVPVVELPDAPGAYGRSLADNFAQDRAQYLGEFLARTGPADVLIALERVGPNHTLESLRHAGNPPTRDEFLRDVPAGHLGRCYSMRGRDMTDFTRPAHLLFETPRQVMVGGLSTIGIGDGGNEIGMGKIPWATVRRNIANGGLVACRVRTDQLIVAGVSNWGAYGLAAGVRILRGVKPDARLYGAEREWALLRTMVDAGPLVDGVTLAPTASVDGLEGASYSEVLRRIGELECR